jgi:hypothetical protein
MATTTLPAARMRLACERAASGRTKGKDDVELRTLLGMLHLASAALSVDPDAHLTVTSAEFLLIADNW